MRLLRELADELRHARLAAGLSQASVASASGVSQGSISRLERSKPPFPDILEAARVAQIVGLDLSLRCFPAKGRLRDAAHIALIQRFLARLPRGVGRRLEAPIRPDDQRAWDVLLVVDGIRIGVIAETRIRDLQVLLRREHQKQLDGRVDRLLLVASATKHNRAALADSGELLTEAFPLGTRAVLTSLSRGEAPEANGVVII
jgi:transcriptional regulator with XRE-family HTH domain